MVTPFSSCCCSSSAEKEEEEEETPTTMMVMMNVATATKKVKFIMMGSNVVATTIAFRFKKDYLLFSTFDLSFYEISFV